MVARKKVLSVFSLIMINVIAVDSIRTLPFSAKLGSSLIFYYAICALLFMIPVAFVTAELSTGWPKTGGIYVWVKEAFGPKLGFLVVWLQWVYNVVWFPSILGLVAGVGAYLLAPELTENKYYIFSIVLVVFWLSTIVNFWGMKVSSIVSAIGSIIGTLMPMVVITILGIGWYLKGNSIYLDLSAKNIIPNITSINDLVLVTTILFGLVGLEMSAVHAGEVKNPSTDFPRSLFFSSIIIILSLTLSSLAVACVVPNSELNVVVGLVQAFQFFFVAFDAEWVLPIVIVLIIVGAVSQVATWIIGPTKGLFAAAEDKNLPAIFGKTNKHGVPIAILLLQAGIVTVLSLLYTFFTSVEVAYLVLTELTAILALLMYVLMFVAAIVLRYKRKSHIRPYKIPFGNLGMWVIASIGGLTSLFVMILGFIPPSQIKVDNVFVYQMTLIIGVIVFCLPAFFIHKRNRKT